MSGQIVQFDLIEAIFCVYYPCRGR